MPNATPTAAGPVGVIGHTRRTRTAATSRSAAELVTNPAQEAQWADRQVKESVQIEQSKAGTARP
jgi:ABC-type sulfate transport system substrate-binding protein